MSDANDMESSNISIPNPSEKNICSIATNIEISKVSNTELTDKFPKEVTNVAKPMNTTDANTVQASTENSALAEKSPKEVTNAAESMEVDTTKANTVEASAENNETIVANKSTEAIVREMPIPDCNESNTEIDTIKPVEARVIELVVGNENKTTDATAVKLTVVNTDRPMTGSDQTTESKVAKIIVPAENSTLKASKADDNKLTDTNASIVLSDTVAKETNASDAVANENKAIDLTGPDDAEKFTSYDKLTESNATSITKATDICTTGLIPDKNQSTETKVAETIVPGEKNKLTFNASETGDDKLTENNTSIVLSNTAAYKAKVSNATAIECKAIDLTDSDDAEKLSSNNPSDLIEVTEPKALTIDLTENNTAKSSVVKVAMSSKIGSAGATETDLTTTTNNIINPVASNMNKSDIKSETKENKTVTAITTEAKAAATQVIENSNENIEFTIPKITKVESLATTPTNVPKEENSQQSKPYKFFQFKAYKSLCKHMSLDPTMPLEVNRKIAREKCRTTHNPNEISILKNPMHKSTKVIRITNLPSWFLYTHVKYLILLLSDYDVENGAFYVEMTKSDQCFIRFGPRENCLQVFKDIYDVHINGQKIFVYLDLGSKLAKKMTSLYSEKVNTIISNMYERKRMALNGGAKGGSEGGSEVDADNMSDMSFDEEMQTDFSIDSETQNDDNSETQDKFLVGNNDSHTNVSVEIAKTCESKHEKVTNYKTETSYKEKTNEQVLQDPDCRIVHLKNVSQISPFTLLRDLLKHLNLDTRSYVQKVGFYKYNNKYPVGDYLIHFRTHEDAVLACKKINGVVCNGNRIEAVMGYGYPVCKEISDTMLQKYVQKRKLYADVDNLENESGPAAKKKKMATTVEPLNYTLAFLPPETRVNETYGLSQEFLDMINVKPPLSHTVFVTNLHPEVTESKLHEVFSLAGNITKVTITINQINFLEEIKAAIEFDHPVEAVQAISMFHSHKLFDRPMFVVMSNLFKERPLPLGLASVGPGLADNGEPLRAVRMQVGIRKMCELFVELGKLTRTKSNNTSPFMHGYIKPKREEQMQHNPAVSGTDNRPQCPPPASPSAQADLKKMDSATIAIKALGILLTKQGLLPPGADYKDAQGLLTSLLNHKNKCKEDPKKDSGLGNDWQINKNVPTSSNISNPPNRLPNPLNKPPLPQTRQSNTIEGPSIIPPQPQMPIQQQSAPNTAPTFNPNQDALNQVMNQVMQYMAVNQMTANMMQPNMAQNFQLGLQNYGDLGLAMANLSQMIAMQTNVPNMQTIDMNAPNMTANMQHMGINLANMQNMEAHASNIPQNMPTVETNIPIMQQAMGTNVPIMQQAMGTNVPIMQQAMGTNVPNMQGMGTNVQNVIASPDPSASVVNQAASLYSNPQAPHSRWDVSTAKQIPLPIASNTPPQPAYAPKMPAPNIHESTPQNVTYPTHNALNKHQSDNTTLAKCKQILKEASRQERNKYIQYDKPDYRKEKHRDHQSKDMESSQSGSSKKADMLMFKNLPPSVTSDALASKMREVGDLVFSETTGRGRAVVRFKNSQDAERCIRLFHRSKVDGQVIEVSLV